MRRIVGVLAHVPEVGQDHGRAARVQIGRVSGGEEDATAAVACGGRVTVHTGAVALHLVADEGLVGSVIAALEPAHRLDH